MVTSSKIHRVSKCNQSPLLVSSIMLGTVYCWGQSGVVTVPVCKACLNFVSFFMRFPFVERIAGRRCGSYLRLWLCDICQPDKSNYCLHCWPELPSSSVIARSAGVLTPSSMDLFLTLVYSAFLFLCV